MRVYILCARTLIIQKSSLRLDSHLNTTLTAHMIFIFFKFVCVYGNNSNFMLHFQVYMFVFDLTQERGSVKYYYYYYFTDDELFLRSSRTNRRPYRTKNMRARVAMSCHIINALTSKIHFLLQYFRTRSSSIVYFWAN